MWPVWNEGPAQPCPVCSSKEYNGWANYETWNVALWMGNDGGLYEMGCEAAAAERPYEAFRDSLGGLDGAIVYQTPDGISWNDSGLDTEALDNCLKEFVD